MKPDEAVVAPAPTREVVGELVFNCLEMLLEMRSGSNVHLGLQVAIGRLALGDTQQTLAILQRLHDEEQEREQRLNRIFERLKTLMHRFAGEPDA